MKIVLLLLKLQKILYLFYFLYWQAWTKIKFPVFSDFFTKIPGAPCGFPLVSTTYIFYIVSSYPRFFIWYISIKHISWEIQIFEVFQFSAIFLLINQFFTPKWQFSPYSAQSRFFIFVSSGVTVLKKVKMISVAIFLRFSCIFDRLTGLQGDFFAWIALQCEPCVLVWLVIKKAWMNRWTNILIKRVYTVIKVFLSISSCYDCILD